MNVAAFKTRSGVQLIDMELIFGHDPLTLTADFPGSTQIRRTTDKDLVERYASLMVDGVEFPPIILIDQGNGSFLLGDGHHRFEARWIAHNVDAKRFPAVIAAEVREGTIADAIRIAIEANRSHGKPLSDADFEQAFLRACEVGLIDAIDATATQELLGCSRASAFRLTVRPRENYKRDRDALIVALAAAGKTERAIAKEVGCAHSTVGDVLGRKVSVRFSGHGEAGDEPELPIQADEPPYPSIAAERWQRQIEAKRQQAAERIKTVDAPAPVEGVYPLPPAPPMPFVRRPADDYAMNQVADVLREIDKLPDAGETISAAEDDEETTSAIRERLDRSIEWMTAFKDRFVK